MLLRQLRAALDLDSTSPESRPVAPSRFALLRRVRSSLDLGPASPESRRAAARLLPLLAPLGLVATLAPLLGRQAKVATSGWVPPGSILDLWRHEPRTHPCFWHLSPIGNPPSGPTVVRARGIRGG